jgi:hypothetical protein
MNRESQSQKIRRFLEGKGKKDIDAFCIYQWIDRCHFEGWWDMALALAPSLPPNSLNHDYHKRLEFLLTEAGKNLKSLKKEFIKVSDSPSEKELLIPISLWETCQDLGLSIKAKSKRGLKLEVAGKQILFLQNIDLKSCVIQFCTMDTEKLSPWLNSHGFSHLVTGVIPARNRGQGKNARLRISWQELENLMPSIIAELGNDVSVLLAMVFEAIGKVKNGTWGQYLDYVKRKYLVVVSDELTEKVRKFLIELASRLEGNDQFVKRLETD